MPQQYENELLRSPLKRNRGNKVDEREINA